MGGAFVPRLIDACHPEPVEGPLNLSFVSASAEREKLEVLRQAQDDKVFGLLR